MANTHHTGIPKLQWVGAYPPCTPSASISVDLSPFCAGDSVMFTPTLNCVENVIITAYAWVVNGIIKSTSPAPFVTTDLANNDKVYFLFVANENRYVSNVIKVVEKTEGCITEISYGLLYNWYAATDVRKITSSDTWVVPNQTQYNVFKTYVGTNAGKLKETGTTYWNTPNTGATNELVFNFRASGRRNSKTGVFGDILQTGYFGYCTSTLALGYSIAYDSLSWSSFLSFGLGTGIPIRLMRPATAPEQLLADGTACEPYVQNDSKLIRTVKIGTQVWLADNLAETKFRNGDTIPEVTDNTAWAALTTAGMCAYDNDWNNV